MYKGYQIKSFKVTETFQPTEDELRSINILKESVKKKVSDYILSDGTIDGKAVSSDWFPVKEVDVFISHSHADELSANHFAAWLNRNFQLKAFVDSAVWGQSEEMLREIDNRYCRSTAQAGNYDYLSRNKSTSYVNMLLATALAKLIDKTECLFFLGTPNAVNAKNTVSGQETNSAWLYYEIALSSLLRKPLGYHRKNDDLIKAETRTFTKKEELKYMTLPIEGEHLIGLTMTELNEWVAAYRPLLHTNDHPLDKLYELKS